MTDKLKKMDFKQLSKFKNIAVRINDLPYHEDFLRSEKIKMVLHSRGFDPDWKKLSSDLLVDVDELFYSPFNFDLYKSTISKFENLFQIQKLVFNSYDLYHILDRNDFFSNKPLAEQDIVINEFIIKSLCLLFDSNIDLIVIHDTPHSPDNHILFECAKALDIPVLNIRQSPIPWCATIEVGLGGESYPLEILPSEECSGDLINLIDNYIKSLSGSYSVAIPEYERKRHIKYNGNLWSWKKELRRLLKNRFSIDYIKKSIEKYQTLRLLESKSTGVSDTERYVVFFLHYQPERTTLPEGGIFNQQLLAIQSLRMILSADVKLVVREHPSTYRNKFKKEFRPDAFYNKIANMDHVILSSPLQNPFDLLDKSLFIATITGTIGIEAVIRGKCCVYFGNAVYKNIPGAYHIGEVWGNSALLQQIVTNMVNPSISEVESYFKGISPYTMHVHPYSGSFTDYDAHLKNSSEALLAVVKSGNYA